MMAIKKRMDQMAWYELNTVGYSWLNHNLSDTNLDKGTVAISGQNTRPACPSPKRLGLPLSYNLLQKDASSQGVIY